MNFAQFTNEKTILDAKAATGAGKYQDVSDYDYAIVTINTASNSTLTVKAAGAISDTAPDMTASQSVTNRYDYLAMYDLQSGSNVAGDTGFSVSSSADHRLFRIDLKGLKWLNFIVTARTAGSVTVKIRLYHG